MLVIGGSAQVVGCAVVHLVPGWDMAFGIKGEEEAV